jgi:hypothetical protein
MRPTVRVVFRNRMAAFLWCFCAVWLAMLGAMTWVLLRDGAPAGTSPALVHGGFVLFWLAGAGGAAWAASRPCFRAQVDPAGGVELIWRYPHRAVRRSLPPGSVGPATVVESEDSEGDPYFHARVEAPGGSSFDLAEGHDRERCERACERFNDALRLDATPW